MKVLEALLCNVLSKDWRLERLQASVNTTRCLVHAGLINALYSNQAPPTMCLPSVYLKQLHVTKSLRPPSHMAWV